MLQGWIKLHRGISENPIYMQKPFSKGQAWIDMILQANHHDREFIVGTQMIVVLRGSFLTSEIKLMDRWGWSKEKVRRFLKLLQEEGMVVKISDRRKTIITIAKYEVYQARDSNTDHDETKDGPPRVHGRDTNKNLRTEKFKNIDVDVDARALGASDGVLLTGHEGDQLPNDGRGEISHTPRTELERTLREKGLGLSDFDNKAIDQVIQSGIPIEDAIRLTEECIRQYKPRFPGDTVRSFKYCAKYIMGKYSMQKADQQQPIKTPSKSDYLDALNKWISEGGIPSEFPGI